MPRLVIDTNVLISAILRRGSVPMRAFQRALHHAEIVSSRSMLEEFADTIRRSKFDRYSPLPDRQAWFNVFIEAVTIVPIITVVTACRDPRDNHVLEAAINGRADAIITGDVDLLALDPYHGIRIVTPQDYLDLR